MIRSTKIDQTDCVFCEGEVVRCEKGRLITLKEASSDALYNKIKALVVADAMCVTCHAKYIGWIDVRAVVDGLSRPYDRTGDMMNVKPRVKDISRAIRAVLKQYGHGLLPGLKILRVKTNETMYHGFTYE